MAEAVKRLEQEKAEERKRDRELSWILPPDVTKRMTRIREVQVVSEEFYAL